VGQILLWAIAIASLALNLFVIKTLLDVRSQAGVAFGQAAGAIGTIKDGTIEYTARIEATVPVALDVPVKFDVEVPIRETIAIDTTVSVPIDFPIVGRRIINLPISTEIPIDITVRVPVDETLPINAEIPVDLSVPFRLRIVDTPFGEGLGELQVVLESQADSLGAGEP
jgi:hypothetical protein